MKKYLATLSILVTNRQANVASVNKILTDSGHLVLSRLGVNPNTTCLNHCFGIIVLVLSGDKAKIEKLSADLAKLKGIKAKLCLMMSE